MMHTPTLAPRDGRALLEPETRLCQRCDTVKPVSEFYRRFRDQDNCRGPCKACRRDYVRAWMVATGRTKVHRKKPSEAKVASERAMAKWEVAVAVREQPLPTLWSIPESECAMQLTIIAACWLSCVEVGAEAIRRMMDRLADATYLPGIVTNQERARLRADVQSYRIGGMPLEQVERTLRGVVGSGE